MGKFRFIFCEGNRNSWDSEVLKKIISTSSDAPEIVPVGGKTSLANFRDGYVKGNKLVSDDVESLVFRDRGFDFKIPNRIELIKTDNKYIYATYRTTIENYLLEPQLLFEYLSEKGHLNKLNELVASREELSEAFRSAAKELKYYEAIRHALGKLLRDGNRVQLSTTWLNKSGELPADFSKEYCVGEASQLLKSNLKNIKGLTPEKLSKNFEEYILHFDDDFFARDDYLVWYNAKDLETLLIRQFFKTDFSLKGYYKYAVSRFDFNQFPDLVELKNLIDQP